MIFLIIHIVKKGETLSSIARQYGVSTEILAVNNSIKNPNSLAVGQPVAIVFPLLTHTVRAGETLYEISRRYGVSLNHIYCNNLILKGEDLIFPGQTLVIESDRTPIGTFQLGGYSYPFIKPSLLKSSLPFLNYLMPFTYGFEKDGSLVELDDVFMLAQARAYGTDAVMHLSSLNASGVFSVENAAYLLQNKTLWPTLKSNVLSTIKAKGYAGLDIDFEYLGKENAFRYAEFVRYMREELNREGYGVLVALAPKTGDDQPGSLYEGHDYELLGKAANCVLLMTYEWGYTFGPPLAVSPVPNVRKVIEYALTKIPNTKIFEGISNYGYDFTLPYISGESRAISLSVSEAFSLAASENSVIRYDEQALAPFFEYTKNGKAHIVWFEDVRSIRAKLGLITEYGLKGGLYWNINRENNQNLTAINCYVNRAASSLF